MGPRVQLSFGLIFPTPGNTGMHVVVGLLHKHFRICATVYSNRYWSIVTGTVTGVQKNQNSSLRIAAMLRLEALDPHGETTTLNRQDRTDVHVVHSLGE